MALDLVATSAAVSGLERLGRWQAALHLLQHCRAIRLLPDVVLYGSVVSACEKGQQWQMTLACLKDMTLADLTPNVIVFNSAISALEKGKQGDKAWRLFQEVQRQKLRPDIAMYRAVTSACDQMQQWTWALQMLSLASAEDLRPDAAMYCATITACQRVARWEAALALLMKADCGIWSPGGDVVHNALLSVFEKATQWELALHFWEIQSESGLDDVISFTATVCALSRGMRWAEALQLGAKATNLASAVALEMAYRAAAEGGAAGVQLVQAERALAPRATGGLAEVWQLKTTSLTEVAASPDFRAATDVELISRRLKLESLLVSKKG